MTTFRQETWNPITGCTPVSEVCSNCNVKPHVRWLQSYGNPVYKNGFDPTPHPDLALEPLHWRLPRLVRVAYKSDIFHEVLRDDYVLKLFDVMKRSPQHQFLVLTKRSKRLKSLAKQIDWADNIWIGVSVELPQYYSRIDDLRKVNSTRRWVAFEPLMEDLSSANLNGISWVVIGDMSYGRITGYRGFAAKLRNECGKKKIPVYMKSPSEPWSWNTPSGLKTKRFPMNLRSLGILT